MKRLNRSTGGSIGHDLQEAAVTRPLAGAISRQAPFDVAIVVPTLLRPSLSRTSRGEDGWIIEKGLHGTG